MRRADKQALLKRSDKVRMAAKALYNFDQKSRKQYRYGQLIFNVAYDLYPTQTNQLRGTLVDCFYDNTKVDVFLQALDNQ